MAEVTNKYEMYDLLHRGKFGNTSPGFDNLFDLRRYLREHPGELCAIRTKRGPKGPFIPYLTFARAVQESWRLMEVEGFKEHELQYSIMMPDHKATFQGFVMRDENYYTLDGTMAPHKNMREAQPYFEQFKGLRALLIMRKYMDPTSFDDIQELFDEYPDAVIEFTCYRIPVGTCKREVTVWEVRNY